MALLLDTNLLLRWANLLDPERPVALAALRTLRRQGQVLHTTPQNYIEFWGSATRPVAVNGLGLTPARAGALRLRFREARISAGLGQQGSRLRLENAKARKGENANSDPIRGATDATSDHTLPCSGSR